MIIVTQKTDYLYLYIARYGGTLYDKYIDLNTRYNLHSQI